VKRFREKMPRKIAFVGGEEFENAMHALHRVRRMERGEDQPADIRCTHRGARAFRIAHFADDDDIGILAQDVTQSDRIAGGIEADLALFDDAFAILEQEFDRVFDGDDVFARRLIDMLDQRGQRRRFAGSRGPG